MSTKKIQFIDTSALSGSTEKLRTEMGQFWQIVKTDYGEVPEFNASNYDELGAIYRSEILNYADSSVAYNNPYSAYLGYVAINYGQGGEDLKTSASADTVTPNYKVPARIYGREDNLRTDQEWRNYLLGGTFRGQTVGGVFSTSVFDTFGFSYEAPYSEIENKTLHAITNGDYSSLEMTCKYNMYLPNYVQYISTLANERLIPNIYFIDLVATISSRAEAADGSALGWDAFDNINGFRYPAADLLSPTITKAVMLEENLGWSAYHIDDAVTTYLLPSYEGASTHSYYSYYYDEAAKTREYLNSKLPANPLSSEAETELSLISQNIIFDNNAVDSYVVNWANRIRTRNLENWPFYNKITFNPPEGDNTTYRAILTEHDYSAKFMSILKQYFLEEVEGRLTTKGFLNFSEYLSVDAENAQVNDIKTTANTTLKSCDFVEMLMYGYNNSSPVSTNSYQIGYENEADIGLIKDTKSSLRYINTDNVLDVLNRTIDSMTEPNSSQIFNDFANWTWRGMYKLLRDEANYDETIAYRVEKIGGPPTGDSQTQNTIQNFWFFNNTDLQTFEYSDTQVKYGEEYTYNIYAYVLVGGMKYKTDDLIITRQISSTTRDSGGQQVFDKYCLEFYNPTTGEPAEQLFTKNNTFTATNQFATTAQITDVNPYLADFNLYYEPSLKIFEVPIGTKTFRPLDSPPNSLDVVPFQKLDNSQTLGFNVKYEEFASSQNGEALPPAITTVDATYLDEYKNTYDMITDSVFTETVSPQAQIQVFRLTERPTAYTDFAASPRATIDLQIENKNYYLTDDIFYDKVQTNQKYYYLFRFINAHGAPGRISTILQAELIDDGGYKYSVFKDLFDEDLDSDLFIQPSKTFKKLVHILPNVNQILLDDSNVEYNDHAAAQLENLEIGSGVDDSLWGKVFKIRLTSKKTGKKADLNLTFNLTEEP